MSLPKFVLFAIVLFLPWLTMAGILPANLRCEAKENPLGIDETRPGLSWQAGETLAGEREQYQVAYQIQVASSPQQLAAGKGDLWDTGMVFTNLTQIDYEGATLASHEACYWHVRIWDRTGEFSSWSTPAFWSMGMLKPAEWTAQWIGLDAVETTNAGPPIFQKAKWIWSPRTKKTVANKPAVTTPLGVPAQKLPGLPPLIAQNSAPYIPPAIPSNVALAFPPHVGLPMSPPLPKAVLSHVSPGAPQRPPSCIYPGVSSKFAAVESCWFRRTFTIPAGITISSALVTMTADSSFVLYVNGQNAFAGSTWNQPCQTNIARFLMSGTNVLAVAANGGRSSGRPGLIGSLQLKFSDGRTNNLLTDNDWITSDGFFKGWSQTAFIPTNWPNALVTGAYNSRSWSVSQAKKSYLPATYLRKDFILSQLPDRAILYVTGLGLVEPHLNGAKVDDDCFVPGWTDYRKRIYYRTYDVTSLLQPGTNTLGAILGDGWFRGNVSNQGQNHYGTKTRLRAQLHLFYPGGTNEVIASDTTWKAAYGPIRQSDIQAGEIYNAQLELAGWDSPGFAETSWKPVATGSEVVPVIEAAPAEPVQAQQEISPIAIARPQRGFYVVNFGQNFAGWVRLKLTNQPPGNKIVMRFGEWLKADGTVFRDNLRTAEVTDTYICKGGVETWEPHFTYHGFQYVEVQGLTPAPVTNTFTGIVVHSSLTEAGAFECSNDQINRIYQNMLWSIRANYFEIPTDCPQRDERMGWCDGIEIMRSGMFALQAKSFFSKWYQDMVDGKLDTNTFPQMAPRIHNFGFSSGWSDCGVVVPYWLYQTYGDTRVAKLFYSDMASHLQHYAATARHYLTSNGTLGDWLAVDGSTPGSLVSTAFYARCASEMAEMAQVLGKTNDAVKYRQVFTNVCSAFQTNFVKKDGMVGSDSQSGYVLALDFNLLTPAQRPLVAAKLVAAVKTRKGYLSTGMVTTHLLLPTLSSIGRSDLAYQMLEQIDYPSWGYMLKLGATSMWEHWDSVNSNGLVNTRVADYPMNSLNHANLGACTEWFYRGILGIDELQPGFAKILINPQPGGGLAWARGYYDSIHGHIASAWQLTNQTLTLNVTIPVNTTAEIHVPATSRSGMLESGRPVSKSRGLTFVRFVGNAGVFAANPGSYSFTSHYSNINADQTGSPEIKPKAEPVTALNENSKFISGVKSE